VLASRFPVHVTYRLVRRLPSARRPSLFRAIRRAFNAGREAFGGRLCHFSVQKDHLHLIVEAANREALSRALQALAIRIARAINRVLGRTGKVFADRYHMRILRTPTEVKNALRYVLDNRWKHNPQRPDFLSSKISAARSPGSRAPSWRCGPGCCKMPTERSGAAGAVASVPSVHVPPAPHHRPDGAGHRTAPAPPPRRPPCSRRPQLAQRPSIAARGDDFAPRVEA
jgi:REP element-mobilizing transposase RayT